MRKHPLALVWTIALGFGLLCVTDRPADAGCLGACGLGCMFCTDSGGGNLVCTRAPLCEEHDGCIHNGGSTLYSYLTCTRDCLRKHGLRACTKGLLGGLGVEGNHIDIYPGGNLAMTPAGDQTLATTQGVAEVSASASIADLADAGADLDAWARTARSLGACTNTCYRYGGSGNWVTYPCFPYSCAPAPACTDYSSVECQRQDPNGCADACFAHSSANGLGWSWSDCYAWCVD